MEKLIKLNFKWVAHNVNVPMYDICKIFNDNELIVIHQSMNLLFLWIIACESKFKYVYVIDHFTDQVQKLKYLL